MLSWLLDRSAQLKLKLRRKWKNKFENLSLRWDIQTKCSCGFLCLKFMNYKKSFRIFISISGRNQMLIRPYYDYQYNKAQGKFCDQVLTFNLCFLIFNLCCCHGQLAPFPVATCWHWRQWQQSMQNFRRWYCYHWKGGKLLMVAPYLCPKRCLQSSFMHQLNW